MCEAECEAVFEPPRPSSTSRVAVGWADVQVPVLGVAVQDLMAWSHTREF